MKALEQFSEQEAEYHLYQSRQDAIRVQLTQEAEFEEQKALNEQERHLKEQAEIRADKAQATAENEKKLRLQEQARADSAEAQLKALLAKTGKVSDGT